jgi:DNA topoisomerase-1
MISNPYPPAKGNWRKLRTGEKRVTPSGLPIAPAFTDVYVSTDKSSDLEAVAKDSKNRTIYIHTKKHKTLAGTSKFKRIDKWEAAYPSIIARVKKHFPKVEEAKVMYLIDKTRFRVGGEGATKADVQAYGATTLKPEHVRIDDNLVKFDFIGKKGVNQVKVVDDPILAQLLRNRMTRPRLFETTEGRVLGYLRTLPRAKTFKVSDIRPFYGTKMARQMIASMPVPTTRKEFKQAQKIIATAVSDDLGNTPGVAMSSYIDPRVWQSWEAGMPPVVKRKKRKVRTKK